jgi:EAL domain-containing protein (putative c-di-GMP-specific phosphodiesterase class I)
MPEKKLTRTSAMDSFPPKGTSTVLLVDDELLFLRALSRGLGEAGYRVELCTSAPEAVERVKAGGIDVVVSDISMPGMTGLELLRTIRLSEPDLPVVLVTGLPALESATEAIEYGALKYLVKPVDPKALKATVGQAAQLYRLARMKRQALEIMGVTSGASDRAGLEAQFERALSSLWVAVQPILRAEDGSVFGYEALLRSGEPALPGPAEVLDAAERLGLLNRLGRVVRERAAQPLREQDTMLFVNLHPEDLLDPELNASTSALAAIADRVVLEVTERASLDHVGDLRVHVRELRERGFRIAIDDLGAGYAGLTSFALLEPDIVKLDMGLVRSVDTNPVKRKLVASMTTLCKDMGLLVVAEGVETHAERDVLIELGCDLLQGYLFARPGPPFPAVSW